MIEVELWIACFIVCVAVIGGVMYDISQHEKQQQSCEQAGGALLGKNCIKKDALIQLTP